MKLSRFYLWVDAAIAYREKHHVFGSEDTVTYDAAVAATQPHDATPQDLTFASMCMRMFWNEMQEFAADHKSTPVPEVQAEVIKEGDNWTGMVLRDGEPFVQIQSLGMFEFMHALTTHVDDACHGPVKRAAIHESGPNAEEL